LWGKPTLDYRHEHDVPDRADRWLRAAERNQLQRRQRFRERRVSFSSTQSELILMKGGHRCQRLSAISATAICGGAHVYEGAERAQTFFERAGVHPGSSLFFELPKRGDRLAK
jgi:hypothetical protein